MKQTMKQRVENYVSLTRFDRPIGITLLLLPCLFGILLSLKKTQLNIGEAFWFIFLFAIGSVVMRSAGCVINDIFDRKFDSQVARTKNRPLASKKVRKFEAFSILAILLICGLVILLQFNKQAITSGFIALFLAMTYPLMKRVTYYPQIFLGVAFNFGILMSGLAILGKIDLSFTILYASCIVWTLIYDTIYAYQDIEDDLRIGVKSSAIKFAKNPKVILILLTILMFSGIYYVGILENFGSRFFFTISAAFALLLKEIKKCDLENPKECLKVFKVNFWVGFLILIGIDLG